MSAKLLAQPQRLILFDGTCGLCHGFVKFVLRIDHAGAFKFASLQGGVARQALSRCFGKGEIPDSICLIEDYGGVAEASCFRWRAAVTILIGCGGGWRRVGRMLSLVPASIGDALYSWIARRRFRLFGRRASCLVAVQFAPRFMK
jgi:predicted DCC family thiol-disulfide oxidoreductase YuxK